MDQKALHFAATGIDTKKAERRGGWSGKLALVALLALGVWKSGILINFKFAEVAGKGTLDEGWRWNKIQPSRDLVWHNCYEKYDCARLDVPLDWLDPSEDKRASIALIRFNATDRENYKGPVFINPGGPGGSGVWFVKRLAPYYQAVVGRNHDIISFDPRGVGQTLPSISCFQSSHSSRIWNLQDPPVIDAHPGILYDSFTYATAFSQQCALQISEGGRFVSTASTARDMLEMMEKVGESKLRYWGFSYGTVLGTTFAAMFPDRIERMVNDGNVDAAEYFAGGGTHFIQDTDKVMDAFYHFCHLAGSEACSFYASSPADIKSRLDALLASIKKYPVIVPPAIDSETEIPNIISYSDVRRRIASSLYRPLATFPILAEALAALESGNGTLFLELEGSGDGNPLMCDDGTENPNPELPDVEGSADASNAILCSDIGAVNGSVEDFEKYVETLEGLSTAAGATMASMRLACVGWRVEAKWRFAGPFNANTSHPILFVANTADNVTPLRSAQQNAKGFAGSVVLVSDSYGHTSLSTPSKCTATQIHAYFQDGTLPEPGTVCDPDMVPFERWDVNAHEVGGMDEALLKLMAAPVVGMGKSFAKI